jgi:hypothetical protein
MIKKEEGKTPKEKKGDIKIVDLSKNERLRDAYSKPKIVMS